MSGKNPTEPSPPLQRAAKKVRSTLAGVSTVCLVSCDDDSNAIDKL